MRISTLGLFAYCLAQAVSAQTAIPDEIAQLRRSIADQKAALDEQNRKYNDLLVRLDQLERKQPTAAPLPVAPVSAPAGATAPPKPAVAQPADLQRDSVGDLNAGQVRAGDFPGSIQLPGPHGLSIGVGGFVKTLAFYDSNAESQQVLFLPATLGTVRDDGNGGFGLSAQLTRFNFDARAAVGENKFRGYLEFDFSGDPIKWRLAYLTWDRNANQMLAGKYWSNFMDLQTLPEGLGEPTLSGAIFTRQDQFRYTRQMSRGMSFAVSAEDPASSDIIGPEPLLVRTAWPDFIGSFTKRGENSHVAVRAMVRRITVDPNGVENFGTTGWGVQLGSHLNLGSKDKIAGSFAFGQGLGRYMLGLSPTAGAFVEVDNRTISARNGYGGLTHLRHQWNQSCRSTIGAGYAHAETDPRQPDTAFRASVFGIANYMCTVHEYVTMGIEYDYGRRWNKVGALDNNRIMFGMQLF